jgi:hypoxanthine phosphoribosyltransferase
MKTDQGERLFSRDDSNRLMGRIVRELCLDGFKPDVIAAISRGGLVMGVQFSHYFATELIVITVDEHKQPQRDRAFNQLLAAIGSGRKVLLADEICDKGITLSAIVDAIDQNFISRMHIVQSNLKTAVLVHNEGVKLFCPDYVGEVINKYEDPSWIVFDWESWW